ncbi:hypothetical protein [Actinacidiphila oryziradicis]|uniref:Uncharacterized protein n=1 Tax=Actinacidiphila oryziradicis TaxID=2571141 RepID=A0A4U0SR54_9ACTN|nr:hypothetical protein [Actinacidiphila oryziradicis]TKA11763.1 hypothetical protein FCI23_10560 [Actinacidiphila oryziradicis]
MTTSASEPVDKVTEYSNKAAHLLRQAEPMLTRTDSRPAPQLIAAAGVWAQLAQVAALAARPATEDVTH